MNDAMEGLVVLGLSAALWLVLRRRRSLRARNQGSSASQTDVADAAGREAAPAAASPAEASGTGGAPAHGAVQVGIALQLIGIALLHAMFFPGAKDRHASCLVEDLGSSQECLAVLDVAFQQVSESQSTIKAGSFCTSLQL